MMKDLSMAVYQPGVVLHPACHTHTKLTHITVCHCHIYQYIIVFYSLDVLLLLPAIFRSFFCTHVPFIVWCFDWL